MAYTPELSQRHSGALRRIAWVLGIPMTTAMAYIFDHTGQLLDGKKICEACRDRSHCSDCVFNHKQQMKSSTILKIIGHPEKGGKK